MQRIIQLLLGCFLGITLFAVQAQAGSTIDRIERSGELVVIAEPGYWFTYYYWLDDTRAPDFAPTVDIHRKPGYDPAELFIDPALRLPKLRIAARLLQKKLGFRTLLDVIPLNGDQVRGTHGRLFDNPDEGPLLIASAAVTAAERYRMTDIRRLILETLHRDS